jgi:hypothetical protein
MKYKVVTTWTVEVTEDEVQKATKGYGKPVDPRQLAVFKALMKSMEVSMEVGTWDEVVAVHFDVTLVTN